MNLLREFIKSTLEDLGARILIPPPPPVEYRVQELGKISMQYQNRFNPEVLQAALDEDIAMIFDTLLSSHNIESQYDLVCGLKEEIEGSIHLHKNHFNTPRPNELAEQYGIRFEFDYLESAQTPSYPSGHTAQAFYVATKLSRLFPHITEDLFILANMIAESRIDRGVHFPSDNEAGKLLAAKLAGEI